MPQAMRSAVIDGPAEAIWYVIRPFDALTVWQPLCPETEIEGGEPPDQIGCIRKISQTDGGHFRERLLAMSDKDYSQTYMLIDPPLSVTSMVTTMRLYPITVGDRTYLNWSSQVDVGDPKDEANFIQLLHHSFMIGIQFLTMMFEAACPCTTSCPPSCQEPSHVAKKALDSVLR